ncbi:MAG: stage V sporulation protein R [Alphaproteobacteria bacterium]|jgi:stage V sporulation protein R|nr:stage V sporulation protein R [Alphaproteobacteria bacterium]
MADWTVDELQRWDEKIREKVEEFGLDCYRQEFELCDHHAMLGYMAYHGMPAHYPHWSYGKSFEKTKTLYDYGVSGLPYELVINSDPCLAYLMTDNSLTLQILTIAHVYGHNDFFKNNFTFTSATDAKETIGSFKARADRVRSYIEDPSIGDERVERVLDAAHALAFCMSPNAAVRRLGVEEQRERARPSETGHDPFAILHKRPEAPAPTTERFPPEPVSDLLAFMRDHHPTLAEWERDLLDIVDSETRYFLPQIETKIMNEGWASYWHHRILESLDLPHDVRIEFLVRHNQVVCPHPGSINPYHLGFVLWHKIAERDGEDAIWKVRESDRDAAFLRRFLDAETMRDLDLFSYEPKGDKLVVDSVADDEHWADVKRKLIAQVGAGNNPSIRITDADFNRRRELYLVHDHDGRDLHLGYAERTLQHLYTLWGRRVLLETQVNGKPTRLAFDEDGFDARLVV